MDRYHKQGMALLEAFSQRTHYFNTFGGSPLACAAATPVFLRWKDGLAPLQRVNPGATTRVLIASFSAPRDTPAILSTLNSHACPVPDPSLDPQACRATKQALRVFDVQAQAGVRSLERGDLVSLGSAMDRAQEAYENLLEAHLPALAAPGLRTAVRAARDCGALGAKFSGAGGDGSVIALFSDDSSLQRGVNGLLELGLTTWTTQLEKS